MGQVLVPLLLGIWLLASAWGSDRLVKLLGETLHDPAWRLAVQILAFVVLLPMPLADELIGRPQFDALCRERARLDIHLPEALGAPTHRQRLLPEPVPGLGLPVAVQPWWVVADGSGLVVASYGTVQARGGWLARWAHADPERGPLSFKGECGPAGLEERLQPRVPQVPPGTSVGQVGAPEVADGAAGAGFGLKEGNAEGPLELRRVGTEPAGGIRSWALLRGL